MKGVPDVVDDEWAQQWPQVCVATSETENLSFELIVYSQIWPLRTPPTEQWEGGGQFLTSYHLCGGEERGGNKRSSQIIRIAGKSQTIHTSSDRASNYFVPGEDDIKPGSIPGNTHSLVLISPGKGKDTMICSVPYLNDIGLKIYWSSFELEYLYLWGSTQFELELYIFRFCVKRVLCKGRGWSLCLSKWTDRRSRSFHQKTN
jgi:hypothetical protein